MLVFSPVRVLRKRKSSDETEEILRRLDDFLNVESPQLTEWLCSVFQDQQTAVTYKELREAILNGYEEQILQWQDDYARLINIKRLQHQHEARDREKDKGKPPPILCRRNSAGLISRTKTWYNPQ